MTRKRNDPWFRRMVIVPVASPSPNNLPPIGFDKLYRVPDLHLNYFLSITLWSDDRAQAKMFHEWIEVPVVIEQFVPTLDASRGNQGIDCPPDREA